MDKAGAVDVLVGVVDGDGRRGGAMLAGGLEAGVDQLIADEGSGAIVDDDEIGRVLLQAQQAETNRVLPALAAEMDVDRLSPAVALELARHLEKVPLGDQERDAGDLRAPVERLEGASNQRPASNGHQHPCAGLPMVKPGPGCRDDGLYLHSSPLFVMAYWWVEV